jgi:putative serine protease PepD
MAPDEEGDEELPSRPVLPPDDRLWRHPSELADTTVPSTWLHTPQPPSGRRRAMSVAALASACITGAVVAVGVMWLTRPTKVVVREAAPQPPRATATFAAAVPADRIAARLAPSLVQVEVTTADGDEVRGTGVWLDDEGTVALAHDLVGAADEVQITDHDGIRRDAIVAGTDPTTGIAIVRVAGRAGTPLQADEAGCTAGQAVTLLATAGAAPDGTATPQVLPASVSAVSLRIPLASTVLHDALQLDRAAPATALGGLVVDADGRAVAVVLDPEGDDGLAVAVPAAAALAAARDLSAHGEVRRAWLGVRAVDLDAQVASLLGVRRGALLTRVDAGSPAAGAELQSGDVVTEVDGEAIADASDLVVALRAQRPGDEVVVAWQRGTEAHRARIVLAG